MRAKLVLTSAVVLAAGTALGLAEVRSGAGGAPESRASAYLLEAMRAQHPPLAPPEAPAILETQVGSASFYANSLAGRRTASGVRYDPRKLIAAHRTLPFGSLLRVTNQANGKSVEVEVVDRGPFARGRVLDLSRTAAERLGFIRRGHTRVTIEVLEYGDGRRRAR